MKKRIDNSYWLSERIRFILVILGGIAGGSLTGEWALSFVLALTVYIAWLLYKVQQLYYWLESDSKPDDVPDSDGIWERITYQIQVTQRKSDRRKQRLQNLLDRLEGIITSLPYATVVLTEQNEIDWANKTSANMLRLEPERDRGQRLDNLIRIPELHQLLRDNKNQQIEITSPHDDKLILAIHLIPIQSDMKLLIARDISERVHVQQMRKNFIANASHELRTPLTVIAGYLEIMQLEEEIPEHLQPAVLAAFQQSERMQSIIEDLLTLSRLENSELSDNKSSDLDVPTLIKRVADAELSIDEHGHVLNTERIDKHLFLRGSEAEITSIISNLVHNALRYTPPKTSIHIVWETIDNGQARLLVRDEGEGIPPEHLTHLTERFYRVDKGRSQDMGGTGLGLAIVQHIVQRHGGKLFIRSEVGTGSEFEVIFPESRTIELTT